MAHQLHDVGAAPVTTPHHRHAARNLQGGIAVLVGAVGVVCGALPFLFPVAAVSGALALWLGVLALRRVHRGEATNGRSARAAVLLGVIALAFAAVGFVVSILATEDIAPPPEETALSVPLAP